MKKNCMQLEKSREDSIREKGKHSEHAILTSRVIDRPMRPLFPKDYRNDVTLNNMVMSVDPECSPEVVAMLRLCYCDMYI